MTIRTRTWPARSARTMTLALGLACTMAVCPSLLAQSPTQSLLDKAHSLEARGRMDMAAQTWQQVLLAEPNNPEALAGLARAAKLEGNQALASTYLDRLKAINANDPNIAKIENISSQLNQNADLQHAGKLAAAGQYAEAMVIYRKVFGATPPPGDWALAYYETEAASEDGRPHAVEGLRALVAKYPKDSRYQIALGRILTYNPKTRTEGRLYLQRHPADPQAMEALRQSLVWDAQNPATTADIRAFLKTHNDPELAQALRNQAKAPASRPGRTSGSISAPAVADVDPAAIAQTAAKRQQGADEAAAYRALNAKHMQEAEERFKALLAQSPDNPKALAGMGYVRMQQGNFGGAISFLEQAKQDGANDAGLENALSTSRFWYTMGEGAVSLNENDLPTAEKQYQTALAMRPSSPEALEGLGGTLLKAEQPEAAVQVFLRYTQVKPTATAAWRGLMAAQYGAGNPAGALITERKMPAAVRTQLMRDPDYLRILASCYSAVGRDADAQRVLHSALELPFPAAGEGLKAETQLQYASLLQQANHLDQAGGLFRQVLSADPTNAAAWQGLIRVQHAEGQDAAALQTLESMPPAAYEVAMRDPGFETTVASIYQQQNKLDIAQDLLEKSLQQQTSAGAKPPVATQLQLASVYLARNNPARAYPIYRQIISADPDRTDAWRGLLSALHSSGRDQEALAQLQQIPAPTRRELENDPDYLQTVGAVYNALGDPREAMVFLTRVQQHYALQHTVAPADIDIQNAWLLYNGMNDTGLYRQLMVLGARPDLTDAQRRTVQTIWTNWAVRRANQAAAANNNRRALAILNAAAKAFPDNPAVLRALATGYARAGVPKQAVLIFKSQDMTSATASDYKAAVGAALAAGDQKDAETWLRFGLNQYPKDAQMLLLGAKFEQARGNSSRAADYYRASLAAMPPGDPGAELAGELSRASTGGLLPNGTRAQDLASLLMPGANDGTSTPADSQPATPYLPSYTNMYGDAPVQLPGGGGAMNYNAVPSYMSVPQPAGHSKPSTLKDYVPQSALEMPAGGYREPTYDPSVISQRNSVVAGNAPLATGVSKPAEETFAPYQPTPAPAPLTYPDAHSQAASTALPPVQPTSAPTPAPNVFTAYQAQRPGPLTAQPVNPGAPATGEVFGSYVPYNPAQPYTPTVKAVTLGDPTLKTTNTIAQGQITDVLPTAHYVPNASGAKKSNSSHPDIEAVQTANVRAHQSDPVTGGFVPAQPASGVDDSGAVTQNAGYGGIQQQVPQPATRPSMQGQSNPPPSDAASGQYGQQYPQPLTGPMTSRTAPRRPAAPPAQSTTATAPQPALQYPGIAPNLGDQPYPNLGAAYSDASAPTDADLMAKNVPPLRGGYDPRQPIVPGQPLSERDQAKLDLARLESSYSGWVGGTGFVRYRSGTIGLDRLVDSEAPFEASVVLAKKVRLSVIPRAIFLRSGALDTTSPANYPYLGSQPTNVLPVNAPAEQFASGVGGEIQLRTQNIALAMGYTPYQFLVSNITGQASWKIAGGPVTIFGGRDTVKDTQLSYAGLRDPATASPTTSGNIWGGVISTGGGARLDLGSERAGFYLSADGASLTGVHVLENHKYEGGAGAYFRVYRWPEWGSLNVGVSFFGMHFDHNELGLSYGNGGYFSPEAYFLASVPVSFRGHYGNDWHYEVNGAIGVQTFEQDTAPYFPLDKALQTSALNGCTPAQLTTKSCGYYLLSSTTGANYNLDAQASYRVTDHWFIGAFLSGNNTSNYNTISGGFSARYLFRPQYTTEEGPTGLFPHDGFRPMRIP